MSEPNPPKVAATSDSIAQASGKDTVRRQLDRILLHPIFEQSNRHYKFEDAVGAFKKAIELQRGHTLPYQDLRDDLRFAGLMWRIGIPE